MSMSRDFQERVEQVFCDLERLIEKINKEQPTANLSIKPQPKTKKHISIIGNVGRLRVQPMAPKNGGLIDVSLSGRELTNRMYSYMQKLFNQKEPDRNHHDDNPDPLQRQPGWQTQKWELVESAVRHYASLSSKKY